jgi:raffinose synthase
MFAGEICLPDWDMFHSLNDAAGLHAASRAVGGCPVYVSDKPGHHDPEILQKLVLPDGKVLRAKLPGRPTRDCLFVDVAREPVALKIWNQNQFGGVVGAFNVQGVAWNYITHESEILDVAPPPATAKVKPYDIETLRDEPGPFAAWSHRSGTLQFLPSGDSSAIQNLDHRDYEVYTIVPVLQSSRIGGSSSDSLLWAPIGLVNMFNSGGAILEAPTPQRTSESTTTARVSCRGPGRFVAFTNSAPSKVYLERNEKELDVSYDEEASELTIFLPKENDDLAHLINVEWNES